MVVQGLQVEVLRKNIKNIYIRIYPPDGRVKVTAPRWMGDESIRSFVLKRMDWILRKQEEIGKQGGRVEHLYVTGETHLIWGREHRLVVVEGRGRSSKVQVLGYHWPGQDPLVEREQELAGRLGQGVLVLLVPPGKQGDRAHCARVLAAWYREQVHREVAALTARWEPVLKVRVKGVYVRRMTTRWGSCNVRACTIRLNTELAKLDPRCLEYVTVHEMVHILEPSHGPRFVGFMDRFMPDWRQVKKMLDSYSLVSGRNLDW